MRLAVLLEWLLVVLCWCSGATASLAQLSQETRGRIAHLSVRNGKNEQVSSGSGFVISSSGRLVTNFHVIDGAEKVVAVFPDRREAEIIGVWAFDRTIDLAVLQLERGSYEPLRLATEPAKEGEEIVVIGSPLGLGSSITTGIVSAVRERGLQDTQFGHGEPQAASWALQITAQGAPGSSGSPIMRPNGDVVGVFVGTLRQLEGARFGIAVAQVEQLLRAGGAEPKPLTSASGARSVRTNLLISAAFLSGLALAWLAGAHLHRRWAARRVKG